MKKSTEKILATLTFCSTFLPLFGLHVDHECMYDECYRIFYDGSLGVCVQSAIDKLCIFLAVFWFAAVMGSAVYISNSKKKNVVSPLLFLFLCVALAFGITLIDPSKWGLLMSLFSSYIIFCISVIIDKIYINIDSVKNYNHTVI